MGTELPSISPMFRLRVKSSINGSYEPADDILECEKAVCQVEPRERQLLILRYQRLYFPSQMAQEFGISRSKAYQWLNEAEWAVHVQLGS